VRPIYIPVRSLKQNYFVQDDLRVTSELTLNFGVRYQLASIPRLLRDIAPELIATGMPGPVRRDVNDLNSRFGFAWSPRAPLGWKGRLLGKGLTVFRGGFGIAHGVV
jgi:outer membrane receptor protein involved in Fe transport